MLEVVALELMTASWAKSSIRTRTRDGAPWASMISFNAASGPAQGKALAGDSNAGVVDA